MGKKIVKGIILCSSLLFISGCSVNSLPQAEVVAVAKVEAKTDVAEAGEDVEQVEVTDEKMKIFFSKFLKIDHEAMLALNQKPKKVNDEYWKVFSAYEEKTNEILGDYLAASVKTKLKKQYLHDDFHFPRFVGINDYMITGISDVLNATIISKQIKEEGTIYEVEITGIADVIGIDWANKKYEWDDEKGYYSQKIFLDAGTEEPGQDKIKVTLHYFVEVPKGEEFTVSSVREKTGLFYGIDEQAHMENNHFINRLSFLDEVDDKEAAVIYKFLNAFMKQNYNFYTYYRKASEANFDTFKIVLETDLELVDILKLDKSNYKQQFDPVIIPLKDNMDRLDFDVAKNIIIKPHVSSSAEFSAYQVVINGEVTLTGGKVTHYEYTYLFVVDKDLRIPSVRLIKQEELNSSAMVKEEVDLDLEEEE